MKHTISVLLSLLAACLLSPALNAEQATTPRVLATLKPLHSIVFAVTDGISEPDLLLEGNISPHLFQVKPSHIRSVSDADVIVWAGEGVERFLPSMIKNFNPDAQSFSMLDHTEIHYLARDKHSGHDHDHGEVDSHFWLDPQNAITLAKVLADELSRLDPHHAAQYKSNTDAFTLRIESATVAVRELLSAAAGSRYLIYHDSLQYLERAFGLGDAIIVAPQPQVQAGGKRLRELHSAVEDQQVGCLIAEPQFRSSVVAGVAEDLGVQTVLIDPLATEYSTGKDLYPDWLLDITTILAECFASANAKQ